MPKKKGGGKRKVQETPEEKAMRLEMERLKAIEDEIHRAGRFSFTFQPARNCLSYANIARHLAFQDIV